MNNFLLSCPQHLGTLKGITVWHDNSGVKPDWFLDKVIIKDMTTGLGYVHLYTIEILT